MKAFEANFAQVIVLYKILNTDKAITNNDNNADTLKARLKRFEFFEIHDLIAKLLSYDYWKRTMNDYIYNTMIGSGFSIIHNNSDIWYLDTPEDDNNLLPFVFVFVLCTRKINSSIYYYID